MSAVPMTKQYLVTKHNALIQRIGPIMLSALYMLWYQIKSERGWTQTIFEAIPSNSMNNSGLQI